MKIVALSDMHGDWDCFRPGDLPAADLVLCAGDLTEDGRRGGEEALSRAGNWLRAMGEAYPTVLWIPGNHDIGVTAETFGSQANVCCALNRTVAVGRGGRTRAAVHGISLCPVFGRPDLAAQFDYATDDPEVEAASCRFEAVDIVLSHCPPRGTLDFWPGGDGHPPKRIGSPALGGYLRRQKPALLVCGHVHQASGRARVGRTLVCNVARRWEIIEFEG